MRSKKTDGLKYSYAADNSNFFAIAPIFVASEREVQLGVIAKLEDIDIYDHISKLVNEKSGSEWVVDMVTDMQINVGVLNHHSLIGAPVELPRYVSYNPYLISLTLSPSKHPYDDYLCLFRCIALHRGETLTSMDSAAKGMFAEWCAHTNIEPRQFFGIQLHELMLVEDYFKININVFELNTYYETDIENK